MCPNYRQYTYTYMVDSLPNIHEDSAVGLAYVYNSSREELVSVLSCGHTNDTGVVGVRMQIQ